MEFQEEWLKTGSIEKNIQGHILVFNFTLYFKVLIDNFFIFL